MSASKIAAAIFGNALEWYDFTIYAAFAVPISKAFFPADSELVSLLLGFVTFGIGFVAPPSARLSSAASPTGAAAATR